MPVVIAQEAFFLLKMWLCKGSGCALSVPRPATIRKRTGMKNSRRPGQIDLLPCRSRQLLLASAVASLAGSASAFLRFALYARMGDRHTTGPSLADLAVAGGIAIAACAWFLGANCHIGLGICPRRRKTRLEASNPSHEKLTALRLQLKAARYPAVWGA